MVALSPRFRLAVTLALTGLLPAYVYGANIQKHGLALPPGAGAHRDSVVKIFTDSYETYRKYAFGHDDVSPITKSFNDGLNGWGASIVDAMSTAHIMGLDKYFDEGVRFVGTIDYSVSKTPDSVSLFETTIRHIGGLLSAYELSGERHHILVKKATEIADKLAYGWVNGSDIPFGHLFFVRDGPSFPESPTSASNIAEAGTLILEWSRLSKYSGNGTYLELAQKAFNRIISNPDPLPGLAAQGISPVTGDPVGGYVTWGGGSDSYFEYLNKWARLSNTNDNRYMDTWHTAVDSTLTTLLRRSTVGNWLNTADYDSSRRIRHVGSHLACFNGGNFIMGGRMLNNETIVKVGLELADSCWNTYAGTTSGIGPEGYAYASKDGNYTGSDITKEQWTFYQHHGFYITSPYYILRPEVLESQFYAWRATGDTKYLDRAAEAVKSFQKWLPASNSARGATGYAGLEDVMDPKGGGQFDDTESFWFAEVLKYLYLIFDDPEHISLDDYVFNTECHPFRSPPAKPVYGSGSRPHPPNNKPFKLEKGTLPAVSPLPFLPKHTPEATPP